ncbi:MAG TPA: CRISPR-associated protein Cas5 [bacterium]|nr:CRISPR-associated protein Cas5 [bacterium]HQB08746.1 CRISPR-associated protein Cas5 [bacterium]HQM85345.1 CRISPR-associated protein Cas5 [bacterium]
MQLPVVHFALKGRFGHFLHAEANKSLKSYPFPSRTSLLGLIGAILGLEKDKPQIMLDPCNIAISGRIPESFWVKNKFQQTLPAPLQFKITKTSKGTYSYQKPSKILWQEWLFNPFWEIWVSLPDIFQNEFANRIEESRYHFSPCLGTTEHIAEISFIDKGFAEKSPFGDYATSTVFSEESALINMTKVIECEQLAINSLKMPCALSEDRIFQYKKYFFEKNSKQIPVSTANSYNYKGKNIIFM